MQESRPDVVERVEAWLEAVTTVAVLATIPLTVMQERGVTGPGMVFADWAIWTVFVVEYAVMMTLVRDRWRYTTDNWLNVAVIVLSFPALPAVFALSRLVRLARVTRIFRLVRVLGVGARGLAGLQSILERRGLMYVGVGWIVLVVVGGSVITWAEPQVVGADLGSGLWWAAATTVSYGDVAPQTPEGRIVALVLLLTGLVFLATLAASVAAYFVEQEEDKHFRAIERRLEALDDRLAGIERRLDDRQT